MQRNTSFLSLALALAILSAACSRDVATPTDLTASADRKDVDVRDARDRVNDRDGDDAHTVTYAVLGDVPYGSSALEMFPDLIASINKDPDVRRAIHIGDIKSGSTECTDAWFQDIAADFASFADPLVYSIGDNEWTDCHRPNNGGYNPLDRLERIRQIFFAHRGFTLGRVHVPLDAEQRYPENQRWSAAGAVFATFHVIGSNNGLDAWFNDPTQQGETPAQSAKRESEVANRNNANIAWLEETFQQAHKQNAAGIVLFLHADLWHPDDRAAGAVFTAHTEFVNRLANLASHFDGPVLIISGDSHEYRVDVGVPWFSLYGATPPANVTQIIVDRSIENDIDWLKLRVDPKSPGVFSWEEVFVS
jgi:hypothetical protein